MSKIKFHSSSHSYVQGDTPYISVSKLLSKYKTFDSEYWSKFKAYERIYDKTNSEGAFKVLARSWGREDYGLFTYMETIIDPKVMEKERKKILREWNAKNKKSIAKGNMYHESAEKTSYNRGFELHPLTMEEIPTIPKAEIPDADNYSLSSNLYELKDGFYPELLLWNEEYRIAGQADKVFIKTLEDGTRVVDIDDYKGLAVDTPILTSSGWKVMNDLKVGDTVYDGNGDLTKITHVSKTHYNPCYRINFDTNDSFIADHEHKWVVVERYKRKYIENEYTTEELFKKHRAGEVLRIKCVGVGGKHKKLPIDPYVLGLWLGDGNSSAGTLTCDKPDIWDEIHFRGYQTSEDHNRNYDKTESRTIFGIRKSLRKLNLIGNKHIPELYMLSSRAQRLDLLRGLMDADGHLHRTRKRCVMNTTSEIQANEVSSLISSLGFKPTIIPYTAKGFNIKKKAYSVCFTPTENPFLVRNTDFNTVITIAEKYSQWRYITNITEVPIIPTKCIAVDSPDKTYLAGPNLIKTHNTNKKIDIQSFKHRTHGYSMLKAPLNHIMDCNFHHYELQLSFYAWMLEQFGFQVGHLCFHHFSTRYDLNYRKTDVMLVIDDHFGKK